ncbi:MAG: alpha-amylase family glycosyl hydrolase [Sphaerochaetaceae bacterium]|nr:alpha-amylase family glycosyl hydrolase [Sphaerochaetaceae bacterium]MDD4006710.1 alpha-amylase family glycosyl hydrolase [Sphaerochaetaceae bacterium]
MEIDRREMRILKKTRKYMKLKEPLFTSESIPELMVQAQNVADSYQAAFHEEMNEGQLTSCAIIHMAYQTVLTHYLTTLDSNYFSRFSSLSEKNIEIRKLLDFYEDEFPNADAKAEAISPFIKMEDDTRCFFVTEVIKANPAMSRVLGRLIQSSDVKIPDSAKGLLCLLGGLRDNAIEAASRKTNPEEDIFGFLTEPARLFPDSITDQLGFIQTKWRPILGDSLILMIEKARGILKEGFHPKAAGGGPGPSRVPDFSSMTGEGELFSDDKNWMPNVVMIAKNTLVWLDQLSKQYKRPIRSLNEIPDEELDTLHDRGFNALWLIGLWERSEASKKIKNLCGNPEAEASAYSIKSYNISGLIGSWPALDNLRHRCEARGIRLASDMVPNHTGLDSDWMKDHKDYFMQQSFKPFPSYSFNGPDLSNDSRIEVKIEDHYFDRSDAAVVFRRIDRRTGETDYIYHGNDGTTMPWNDTAQLNFLNQETKEAVIQQILEVARNFHIIRFDAAMTLAKKHIRRLWYPAPGTQPDIAGRAVHSMTDEEFDKAMPNEFWREVVDRVASEVPDTLLLAEAFWMMEGYFVRTLGMHRVYNSAFMNMLKNQENQKYRDTIKKTILFDPEILKRYVNFMNNPDEEPAVSQFGNGDRYFGVCTLLSTMPGLPMFGHGQIEGFSEKYGMEYTKAYWNETPDAKLIERHQRQIFPLLKMRWLFSNCEYFQLFDAIGNGGVLESVFAYANGTEGKRALVLYNNQYERTEGWIKNSAPKLVRNPDGTRETQTCTIAKALGIPNRDGAFVLARKFGSRLSYLIPASKISHEGLHIQLNGFETKVFTDISIIDDINGVLAKLYSKYGGNGMIEDFDNALGRTLLSPLFEMTANLLASEFKPLLSHLVDGTGTPAVQRKLASCLQNFYQRLMMINPQIQMMGLKASAIETELTVRRLARTLSKPLFRNAGQISGHCFDICTAFLILRTFSDGSLRGLLHAADRLMLDSALGMDPYYVHLAALICLGGKPGIEELLGDQSFRMLIGANMYQGVTWFKSEAFLDAVLACLAGQSLEESRLIGLNYEKKFSFWLEKVHKSQYILDNLASKD